MSWTGRILSVRVVISGNNFVKTNCCKTGKITVGYYFYYKVLPGVPEGIVPVLIESIYLKFILLLIYVFSMSYLNNNYNQYVIFDFCKNSIVTHPISPFVI